MMEKRRASLLAAPLWGSETTMLWLCQHWILGGVVFLLISITMLHYLTSAHLLPYHTIYRSLYFLPIAMAAVVWGLRGGISTALVVTVLHLPYMLFFELATSTMLVDNLLELALFFSVAVLVGLLSDSLHRQRRQALTMRAYIDGILASLPIGVATIGREGTIHPQNPAAHVLLGEGLTSFPVPPGTGYSEGEWHGRPLGIHRSILAGPDQMMLGEVLTLEDQSEQRRLAEHVRQAERLAALGKLAGGLAHEVRNPLGILRATAQLLTVKVHHQTEIARYTQVVMTEADRIDRLIGEVLSYAHPRVLERVAVEPDELVKQLAHDCQPYAEHAGVTLCVKSQESPSVLIADREQLRQALLNLLLNAIQMSSPGQTVTLSWTQTEASVCFLVRDAGPGIPTSIRSRVFDPFFTTREEGTGMGLAVVARIVADHQGCIDLEQVPGSGTLARLCLPRAKESS